MRENTKKFKITTQIVNSISGVRTVRNLAIEQHFSRDIVRRVVCIYRCAAQRVESESKMRGGGNRHSYTFRSNFQNLFHLPDARLCRPQSPQCCRGSMAKNNLQEHFSDNSSGKHTNLFSYPFHFAR